MTKQSSIHHQGFTLTEIIIVILVLGVLATLALPNLSGNINRMRSEEAKNILRAYYMGFMDFVRDTGADPTDLADIDTDLDAATLKYYNAPNFSAPVTGYPSAILQMDAKNGSHSIVITRTQTLVCVHPSGQPQNCSGLGLPTAS